MWIDVGIGAEERTRAQKENDPELDKGFLAAIWRKKFQDTQNMTWIHAHSHLSLLHVNIPYIEASICAEYMRTCTSFPSSARFLMRRHYFPSVLLIPIYLHPSLCLQFTLAFLCCRLSAYLKKWPSMVISFVLFLGGRYGTFAPHHWSLISYDLLLMWLKNSLFFLFLQEKRGNSNCWSHPRTFECPPNGHTLTLVIHS